MKAKLTLICLALGVAFAVSGGAWAQSTDAGSGQGGAAQGSGAASGSPAQGAVKDQAPKTVTEEVPALPPGSSVLGSGLFGPVSAPQAAVSASYGAAGGNLSANQGASIKVGDVSIFPKVLFAEGRNSNVVGASNASNMNLSAWVSSLQPEINAQVYKKADRYGLVYRGNFSRFSSYSGNPQGTDDFDNHTVEAYGDNVFSGRSRLSWGLGYEILNDARGSSTGVGIHSTPDRWHAPTVRGLFSYGAPSATGRLEIEGSAFNKTYENNLVDMAKLNVNSTTVAGRFFYRVMPKTNALFEVRQVNNSYNEIGAQPDNKDQYYLIGVTWEATAKTTGVVKVGRMQRSFADATPSNSTSSWEADIKWRPLSYSTFDLGTSRTASDGTGVGQYLINTNNSVGWTHTWSSKWTSHLSVSNLGTDYVNAASPRSDDTRNYMAQLRYEMRRWLRMGVDYTRTDRTSTDTTTDNSFRRNLTMFTVEGTL